MPDIPQIRYLTGFTGIDSSEDQILSGGFLLPAKGSNEAVSDLMPPSNFYSAGDIETGPTEIRQGDVLLMPRGVGSALQRLIGTDSLVPWLLLVAGFIVCFSAILFCGKRK